MVPPFNIEHFVFVNFASSNLRGNCWPNEVGMAWIVDGTVQSWSSLIRPEAHWRRSAWTASAVEAHAIPSEDIYAAPPASDVAHAYLSRIDHLGKIAVSDVAVGDARLAGTLLATADAWPGLYVGFEVLVMTACRGDSVAEDTVLSHLKDWPLQQRAEPDVVSLATAVLAGLRVARAD